MAHTLLKHEIVTWQLATVLCDFCHN